MSALRPALTARVWSPEAAVGLAELDAAAGWVFWKSGISSV